MLATASPYQQYFSLAGAPLTGGYLYFGTAGANPETSPITVYWDEAGTQPATQPIRTVGGYVARSGTPARLFVASNYSVTVRDSRKQLVSTSTINSLGVDLATAGSATGGALVAYQPAGTGAVPTTLQAGLNGAGMPSVHRWLTAAEIADVQAGTASLDVRAKLQASQDANLGPIYLPPGVYAVSGEVVVKDGCGFVGTSAFWKRRTSYVYNPALHSVIKYTGASGALTCVVRASALAVGTVGTDFSGPETDDLMSVTLRDFHVDAGGLAQYGVYVYRAGNQATLNNLTAEKAVGANHVHLGCYAAAFGTFGAYEAVGEGITCGWDIFGWAAVESTNFAYSATFLTANNGTGATYVAGTGTDQVNSGGRFSAGRGSLIRIISEGNFGRACVLSQYNIGGGTSGLSVYDLAYLEANADGPYIDYRDAMDGLRITCGFIHPGNGSTLLPQDIFIQGKNGAGVVTVDAGPADSGEWLVIEGALGDLSGVGFDINSNTFKYIVRGSTRKLTFSGTPPGIDDYVATKNQVGASVSFTASATPTVFNQTNGVLTRSGVGIYLFTFTRDFNASVEITPVISVSISAALDTRARITSLSATSCTITTYNAAGATADTGDRIGAMFSGTLVYAP